MGGGRVPGPLGRDSSDTPDLAPGSSRAGFSAPGPLGSGEDPIPLSGKTIVKVTKNWTDPPTLTPGRTPTVSGKTLKAVLVELKKLAEWGSGGGVIDDIQANSPDSAPTQFTVNLTATFTMTLVDWADYRDASTEQKAAWDAMIVKLKKHEQEHVRISHSRFNKLVSDLRGKPVETASSLVVSAKSDEAQAQIDFDSTAQTDHGANAFGSFPIVELDTSSDPPPPQPKAP